MVNFAGFNRNRGADGKLIEQDVPLSRKLA